MTNPNDLIRDLILRFLYDTHKKARGPKSLSIGIKDLQGAMKGLGIKQADVTANLDYLVQKGWATPVVEDLSFTTPQGTVRPRQRVTYKITDVGIDLLEGASAYLRPPLPTSVNVTNIKGVTVIGSGNVVNTELTDLSRLVQEAEQAVASTSGMTDEERLAALADLATIQSQISKPSPAVAIIKAAWDSAEKVLIGAGIVELAVKIAAFLQGI